VRLPFTVEQFLFVFESYNNAIWPAQIVAYVVGIFVVIGIMMRTSWSDRFVSGMLASFWAWVGICYHILHFSVVNPSARFFGVLFVVEGCLLFVFGVVLHRLSFGWSSLGSNVFGAILIVYSMLLYPLLGYASGHEYPRAPMFGVTPCPTTIFTFGVLLLACSKVPWFLFVVPLLWSVVGASAAINLHVQQDYGLVVAGIVGTFLIVKRNKRLKPPVA
jgi:hypothetical protein